MKETTQGRLDGSSWVRNGRREEMDREFRNNYRWLATPKKVTRPEAWAKNIELDAI